MRCLLEVDKQYKEALQGLGGREIVLEYRFKHKKTFFVIDFPSLEAVAAFIQSNNNAWPLLFHADGREMVNGSFGGVAEWPEELQGPVFGLNDDWFS